MKNSLVALRSEEVFPCSPQTGNKIANQKKKKGVIIAQNRTMSLALTGEQEVTLFLEANCKLTSNARRT